jgi:hypothetical protein
MGTLLKSENRFFLCFKEDLKKILFPRIFFKLQNFRCCCVTESREFYILKLHVSFSQHICGQKDSDAEVDISL